MVAGGCVVAGGDSGVPLTWLLDGPVPAALTADTVNSYLVPLVRPVTVQLNAPLVVHVLPPGEAVTVYPVIGEDALNDRWDAELRHREEKNVEIVVLAADSEDALRSTHGRYFRVAG